MYHIPNVSMLYHKPFCIALSVLFFSDVNPGQKLINHHLTLDTNVGTHLPFLPNTHVYTTISLFDVGTLLCA